MNKKPLREKTYIQQGFNACKQGQKLTDNPYPINDRKGYTRWREGWRLFYYSYIEKETKQD
jgi:hypothetical protein